jgi:hypothetical protein
LHEACFLNGVSGKCKPCILDVTEEDKVFSRNETVELMHSVQFPESFESNFQYGLGWMLWNGRNIYFYDADYKIS